MAMSTKSDWRPPSVRSKYPTWQCQSLQLSSCSTSFWIRDCARQTRNRCSQVLHLPFSCSNTRSPSSGGHWRAATPVAALITATLCYLDFSTVGLAHDVDTARDLLQQHQDMKKSTSSAVSVSVGAFFQSGSLEYDCIDCRPVNVELITTCDRHVQTVLL